jgi:signal transduction histidine kinase
LSLRAKLLSVFILLGLVPTLLTGAYCYLSGANGVDELVREDVEGRASRIAARVDNEVRAHEADLCKWVALPAVRSYVKLPAAVGASQRRDVPEDMSAAAYGFVVNHNARHFESLALIDRSGHMLRMELSAGADGRTEPRLSLAEMPESALRVDPRVWEATECKVLNAQVTHEPFGSCVRLSVPVFAGGATGSQPSGALVAELKLGMVFKEAVEGEDTKDESAIVALDNQTGRIIYHTKEVFRTQSVDAAMPFFKSVAGQMTKGDKESTQFYDDQGGLPSVAAYRQIQGLGVSVAATRQYGEAAGNVRTAGMASAALLIITSVVSLLLLSLIAQRATGRIERVTKGAAAIAHGNLQQRIEVQTNDETRGLAESFNLMSDRLRELITREAESRQFESFMHLSAMLTHDLKNSITGLSMLVRNMERHAHDAAFRADAITSLRGVTDKLRRIVSRLSEPVKSLSGEYRRAARETDLVAIIRRVLATNVEPSVPLYKIDARLPDTLVVVCEPERIENVIENLVINALEAMGTKGGRLTVEAGETEADRVFFSVADTGAGMTQEFIRTRLYRPFSTTKPKGIGLGLFTCREIVESHGGRLEVESRVGAGTRFRVVLPSTLFSSGERRK